MLNKLSWKDQTLLQQRIIIISIATTVILIIIGIILFYGLGRENYFYLRLGQLLIIPTAVLVFATGFSLRDAIDSGDNKILRVIRCIIFGVATIWYLTSCEWQQFGDTLTTGSVRYWGATNASLIGLVVSIALIGVITVTIKMRELSKQPPRIGDLDLGD